MFHDHFGKKNQLSSLNTNKLHCQFHPVLQVSLCCLLFTIVFCHYVFSWNCHTLKHSLHLACSLMLKHVHHVNLTLFLDWHFFYLTLSMFVLIVSYCGWSLSIICRPSINNFTWTYLKPLTGFWPLQVVQMVPVGCKNWSLGTNVLKMLFSNGFFSQTIRHRAFILGILNNI